jgi:hypothetical protein
MASPINRCHERVYLEEHYSPIPYQGFERGCIHHRSNSRPRADTIVETSH